MTETIVFLDPMDPKRAEVIRTMLPEGFVLTHGTKRGDDHLKEIIADADYAVSGQVGVSGDVLRAARKLKLLHKWGVGVDNLDIETARQLGIKVARTTGNNTVPVAEFTIALALAALRCIPHSHMKLRGGEWRPPNVPGDTFLLSGKTVGIIGFGSIGQTVAKLLRGFGCRILYYKRNPLAAEEEQALGARHAPLAEIYASADVIMLNCPLTPETTGLVNKDTLAAMKRTAVLVNTARGGVVVEDDLVEALRAGTIRAAAMDVYSIEPLPADSALLTLDNCVVTPHLAAIAIDIFEPTVRRMFRNMQHVSRGEPVPEIDSVV
jgi:D-3-phosphoglycerate dehydrogenase